MLESKLRETVRAVPDFPKKGIVFRDITPILKNPGLCLEVVDAIVAQVGHQKIDVVAGVESRGFLFGLMLANRLQVPFVPIRKKGKLPFRTVSKAYALEYGEAVIEMHEDALEAGSNVLIHDDLLATGGTILAASELIKSLGGKIAAYSFVISLEFLKARKKIEPFGVPIHTLLRYNRESD